MKEAELRKHAKCTLCKNPVMASGLPLFWRVTIDRFGVNTRAVERQSGLAALMGSAGLAAVMGPDEDMARPWCHYSMLPDHVCNKCGRIHGYSHPPADKAQRLRDAAGGVLAIVESIGRRAFTLDGWMTVQELRRALEGGE